MVGDREAERQGGREAGRQGTAMRDKAGTYKRLSVWQKACDLVVDVYQATRSFPDDERFGLVSQMRRTAVSVPANLAEGSSRSSIKDYLRFVEIATGSLYELRTYIELAARLQYLTREQADAVDAAADEIAAMLYSLVGSLKRKAQQ